MKPYFFFTKPFQGAPKKSRVKAKLLKKEESDRLFSGPDKNFRNINMGRSGEDIKY